MIVFESALSTDLPKLEEILFDAKKSMADQKIYQWTENYPSSTDILTDIQLGELFLLKNEGEIICMGTFTRKPLENLSFHQLSDKWFVKRLITKTSEIGNGIGNKWLEQCIDYFTQEDERIYSCTNHTNFPMQRLFEKNNFVKIDEKVLEGRESLGSFYVYEREIGKIHE